MAKTRSSTLPVWGLWLLVLALNALLTQAPLTQILNKSIPMACRQILFALAVLPTIKVGAGPNFALAAGAVCGALAAVCLLELGLAGIPWLLASLGAGSFLAAALGLLYGRYLKALNEPPLIAALFLGYAAVSLISGLLLLIPFKNHGLLMPDGALRSTIVLQPLSNVMLYGLLILLIAVAGLLIHKLQSHALAAALSMALGAAGMIILFQSQGYLLTDAIAFNVPLPAIMAIFLGGGTIYKARFDQAVAGVLLLRALLALFADIANIYPPHGDAVAALLRVSLYAILLWGLAKKEEELCA